MNFIIYPAGLPIALSLVGYNSILTGFLILLKRRDKIGFQYLIFSFAVFLWGVGVSFMLNNDISYDSACFWGRFSQIAALFIPVTWFHFMLVYLNKVYLYRSLLIIFYVLSLLIFPFTFGSTFIVGFRSIVGVNRYPIPGLAYVAFTILFVTIVSHTFTLLYFAWQKEKIANKRADLRIAFFANLYGFFTGSLSFLPVYEIKLPQYNLLIMPLWQYLLVYAMVRHQLFDVGAVAQAFQREKLATIGLLAASVNHEIRNPLYAAREILDVYIENLKEGIQNKDPLQITEKARIQINRALDIITKLNRFAKPTSETVSNNSKASIPEALQNVLDLVSYEFKLDKIHIENNIPKDLPTIQADQRQLEEILFNLIVNACHAMKGQGVRDKEQGGGILEIRSTQHAERITVEIEDTGTGIPPEQAKHLFEPFHTTKGENGTGLGLYITKQLVERNGGKITVTSRTSNGTTVTISFPIVNGKKDIAGEPVNS